MISNDYDQSLWFIQIELRRLQAKREPNNILLDKNIIYSPLNVPEFINISLIRNQKQRNLSISSWSKKKGNEYEAKWAELEFSFTEVRAQK